MEMLSAAAERQRNFFTERAARQAADAPAPQQESSGRREFDADDPTIDSVTGLATRADFEAAMEEYESDEATLVVVDGGPPQVAAAQAALHVDVPDEALVRTI